MKVGDFIEVGQLTYEVIEIKEDLIMCKCISMDSPFRALHRIALSSLCELIGENIADVRVYTEEERIKFLEGMLKRNVWNIRGDN